MSRPSPPYSANDPKVRGMIKKGNDGLMYKSRSKYLGGIHQWMKVTQLTKQRKSIDNMSKSRKGRQNTREKKNSLKRDSRRSTRRRSKNRKRSDLNVNLF
jgi:hypothetical protein